SEVLVPTRTWDAGRGWLMPGLELLDGQTGQSRWRQSLQHVDQQIDLFLAGQDINGDGVRDIFAASLDGEKNDVYVDALSGKDGQRIWWSKQAGVGPVFLERIAWWHPDHEGWPRLLVTTVPEYSGTPGQRCLTFSSRTGEFTGAVKDVDEI